MTIFPVAFQALNATPHWIRCMNPCLIGLGSQLVKLVKSVKSSPFVPCEFVLHRTSIISHHYSYNFFPAVIYV
jgi:hypothetical protein